MGDKRKMVPTTRSARSTQRAVWQEIAGLLDYVMLRQKAGAASDELPTLLTYLPSQYKGTSSISGKISTKHWIFFFFSFLEIHE